MGNSEVDPPVKASKSSAAQEQPSVTSISPATPVYPDWSTFQAYSPIPSPGFFHSTVASTPSPHPYVWGAHPLLPPYGTPPPYVLYPPGGIYGHPSMTFGSHPFSPYAMVSPNGNRETSGAIPANREAESKPSEGKEKSSIKRSEGSLGSLNIIVGKNSEFGKTSGASVNEAYSQSGDSGSEDSSEGSDANSQNDSPPKASDHHNSSDAGTPQNGNPARTSTGHGSQNEITRAPSQPVLGHTMPIIHVPVPAVSGAVATSPSPIVPICDKTPSTEVPRTVVPGAPSKLWMQDEQELKRQRRMESNRESAKRSRLRKQAECEELAHRVEVLEEENASLRAELNHMKKKYEQLTQNTSLKESLGEITEGTEELIPDENQKSSADDDHQKNIDSDGKGREAD